MSVNRVGFLAKETPTGTRVPLFSPADIEALVQVSYGLEASVTPLPGEVDHNFLVSGGGSHFVLRLSPPGASEATARFQIALARHLEDKPVADLVQKVVPNASGEDYWHCRVAGVDGYLARSTTFLPGILQRATQSTPAQRRAVGATLAAIQLSLTDFLHVEARHELMWDMLQVHSVRRLAHELTEPRFKEPITAIDDYLRDTLPALRDMPAQVCHNDLNSNNVLVDPESSDEVMGVLDFGDAIYTASVADVAIGAAYNLSEGDGLLNGAIDFVSGFRSVKHIGDDELAIIPRLVLARLAVRIIITEWRARHRPHNRDYILKNTPLAWSQFNSMWGMGAGLEQQFKDIRP
jgi:Ser/Thr protein kinase RdoA (MazF antagonist)